MIYNNLNLCLMFITIGDFVSLFVFIVIFRNCTCSNCIFLDFKSGIESSISRINTVNLNISRVFTGNLSTSGSTVKPTHKIITFIRCRSKFYRFSNSYITFNCTVRCSTGINFNCTACATLNIISYGNNINGISFLK